MKTVTLNLTESFTNGVQRVLGFRSSLLLLSGDGRADSTLSRLSEAGNESLAPEASRPEHLGAGALAGPFTAPPKETLETILLALDTEK